MPGDGPREAGDNGPRAGADSARRRGFRLRQRAVALSACAVPFLQPVAALAQEGRPGVARIAGLSVGTLEVIQLSMFVGVMGAALLSAVWLIRERARTARENLDLRAKVSDLGMALQRSEALLNTRDQKTVVWMGDNARPNIVGALPAEAGVPEDRQGFLAFGRWLAPASAGPFDRAVSALREHGTPFDLVVEAQSGILLEVRGRRALGNTMLRFAALSEAQRAHARLKIDHQRLSEEHATVLGLLEAIPLPFWLRSAGGRLQWVNAAYAAAVEADTPSEAVRDEREFLASATRDEMARQHAAAAVFQDRVSTVIAGDRRIYAVTDFASELGSAGIACDVSETMAVRDEYERMVKSHAETLDQLNTAVAIFDTLEKLRFYNQAFQELWSLDPVFLDSAPDNAMLLDRLRSEGKVAEQPEWRRWKESLLSAYRAVEPQEHWWHLPDGRTVRVIANPQPKGGVTWVFENLTERIDLESRYNTAVRVQGETLDNLAEGVAVFGPDGRIRLSNPAFATLWELSPDLLRPDAHISAIRTACAGKAVESPWDEFVAAATGFDDERRNTGGQVEMRNGTVLRYAVIHLPNGQVMMTFVDITDSVNVERALKDKNDALQRADQLKNDFVQHVSYELRSPLTNIIGFTELLKLPDTGPLNQRQSEYVDHIGSSSSVLLTIVNDILDLATVDAGIMELDIAEVPIAATVNGAAELVAERLREHAITLDLDIGAVGETFFADEHRVRQVLFNLLSNAANYAPEGSTITLAVRMSDDAVEFAVRDRGPGMPPEILQSVFHRFEPRVNGGRRRGAGLGLSIVKSFVELHGGTVAIESGAEAGTTVTCRFPRAPAGLRAAAE